MKQTQWNFSNQSAIVTGGSRGIGAAVVKGLADAGAEVLFTYSHDEQAAMRLIEQCGTSRVTAAKVDFTDPGDMEAFLNQLTDRKVDCVVNNAGLLRDGPLYKMKEAHWQHVFQVNVEALFAVCKKLIPALAISEGRIVNISSVSGISGTAGQVNYSTAKAGVIGFTKSLAREIGPLGIRVNAVAPGFVETDMLLTIQPQKRKSLYRDVPLRRLGKPEEIASTVLFLLSDAASYMTGSIVVADGGLY
ncbi:SDR family NAD(P)-dependent oxidoreductase [Marinicrinis sediminis]|uniref:SDR family NAD(P)-dependent oxidoreductase n=1 Tax=Marinicrinis sediminis TaxID=1652465 RepID=A0ABW5RFC1_9BACL